MSNTSNKTNKYSIFIGAGILIIAALAGYFSYGLSLRPKYETTAAVPSQVIQGVSVNGTVQAAQDLKLSFQGSGTINQVSVKVGDQVKQGQVLASIDAKNAHAMLDQANASLAAAQANYQKVLSGATNAQVQVNQTALANATSTYASTKAQQDTAVNNAYLALLNTAITAVPAAGNPDTVVPTVSGTYTGSQPGSYQISVYAAGNGMQFQTTGLESAAGNIQNHQPVPLGTKGLFLQFSSTPSTADTWTITLPNTFASAYQTNANAYQTAVQAENQALTQAQAAVDQAKTSLELIQTPARPEDIAAGQAQIDAARAAVETAQNAYSNMLISAPIEGTITEVDAKIGQTASPGMPEIGLISNQKFQVVAYISENDLSAIKVNDAAQVTLSAYGDSVVFPATVIDISSDTSMNNGSQGYKVTLEFNNPDGRIISGMAAHVNVADMTHDNVLAVPASAIFSQNGSNFVLETTGGKKLKQQAVQVGIRGLNNLVEITGGLNAGDQVVYFGK